MSGTRRAFIKQSASAALAGAVGAGVTGSAMSGAGLDRERGERPYPQLTWPEEVQEGPNTPRLCQWYSRTPTEATVRRWRQAGINGAVITNPPELPWDADTLRADQRRLNDQGIHIACYLIQVADRVVRGEEGRDEAIEDFKSSVVAAGAAGIGVVEYNWYVHRLSEGYYEEIDAARAGAGHTAFDYDREVDGVRVRDLPPPEGADRYTYEELWDHYEHFLREVVPVAEAADVRLAIHPNDPPAPVSRANPQIMGTVQEWKRMVETVDSPANGMTVHAGVTAEVGFDSVEFLRWMGRKDRVNHVHYRNVRVDEPCVRYAEVFPDTGETDMFTFMRELIRQGYNRGILAEHPRALDFDRENGSIEGQYAEVGGGGHGGELYDTGYARAMMQAALISERGTHGARRR